MIPCNKPYLTGKETDYIRWAVKSGKISRNGIFTKKTNVFLKIIIWRKSAFSLPVAPMLWKWAAILCDIQPGDEVII